MSEERTENFSGNRSFEERVFARFDSIDARFDAMEVRLDRRFDGLDSRVQALEAKALDTKPIWERALAEILEVKQDVAEVKERVANIERKFDVLILDMMQLRGDQRRVNSLFDRLESNTA
jgi:chromosome segregation ATPase